MEKVKFNNDWFFSEQPLIEDFDYERDMTRVETWHAVDVPHDWLIGDVTNLYRDGEGWYKKQFEWELSDNCVSIRFDGVYQDSSIYLNQTYIGSWQNGYTAFEFDITSHLLAGQNEILVRTRHEAPNSRWYSGSGIYRDTWLIQRVKTHIKTNGVYCHTEKIADTLWRLNINTSISNGVKSGKLSHYLIDENNATTLISQETWHGESDVLTTAQVVNPMLWSTKTPYLYRIKSILITEDGYDEQETTIGFRTFRMSANDGFYLNDEPMKLQGVCLHHDLGALGAAFNRSAQRRQLTIMKEMGVNAIRTAHNPASEAFIELADEMGFLIQSEFSDVWKHPKTTFDYARFFDKAHEQDVKSWIIRDRNHPSVFMWSIGNEIYDTHGRTDGLETARKLRNLVEQFDPKQNAVITFGSNYLLWENTQRVADELKIVGYNYGEQLYQEHHEIYPDWIIYGSETLSTVASRGIYHFPLEQSVLTDDDEQCSSLGNSSTSWGAKSIEWALTNDRDTPYTLGQFLWTGVDYIGEPTPYHTKNSYLGQVDTAGFPKDAYYMIQAMWTSAATHPMVHIFPYWDFSNGQEIDVRVATNAPKVALFQDQTLIDVRDVDLTQGEHYIQNWKIPYTRGELTAVAYDVADNEIARDTIKSFDDGVKIVLSSDKYEFTAGSQELIFVTVEVIDSLGVVVENANNRIDISVTGSGRLVGLDNGNATDYDSYKGTSKRLFSGKLLAIIAPTQESGTIEISASSPGLTGEKLHCYAQLGENESGLANAFVANQPSLVNQEIPIRKIELVNISKIQTLTPDVDVLKVKAISYPSNADKQELIWRLTDVKGIDSQIAELVIEGDTVTVRPRANGVFYLRCAVKNNRSHVDLYAALSFTINGFKALVMDPYQEISGGLVSRSNVTLTNGNERGIATLRNETSYVVFDKVDFGTFGSDQLLLSLFPLEGEPFPIEIWKGYPYASNSSLIDTVIYSRGTIWNTYQDELFTLKEKFRGIQTIGFVFKQKVHVKSFHFIKKEKVFSEIKAIDYDLIYGDSFTESVDAIEHIGNNVTLQYQDMDFGQDGSQLIRMLGKSIGRQNTIQIKQTSFAGEAKIFIEFPETQDYEWHEFSLPVIKGTQKIEFIFLPGSDFHFKAFQFMPIDINKKNKE